MSFLLSPILFVRVTIIINEIFAVLLLDCFCRFTILQLYFFFSLPVVSFDPLYFIKSQKGRIFSYAFHRGAVVTAYIKSTLCTDYE